MATPMALTLETPKIDTMGAFAQGATAAENMKNSQFERTKQGVEQIAAGFYGMLKGDLDAKADPQQYEQTLDYFEARGVPVDEYRGKPEMANIIARGSIDVLKLSQDERSLEFQMQQFAQKVSDAAKGDPTENYRPLTEQEAASYGLKLGGYQINGAGQVKEIGGGNTTVNVGGEPQDAKFLGALDENTGKLWSSYEAQGAVSAGLAQDFQVLDELVKVAPQGPIDGRLAAAFPGISSSGDAFTSIVKRVAPSLRVPGSGATSDIEYDGMLRSLPALGNTQEANILISEIMKAKAQINIERATIVSKVGSRQMSVVDGRAAMAELDRRSILTPQMKAALEGVGVEAGAAAPSDPGDGDWTEIAPNVKIRALP